MSRSRLLLLLTGLLAVALLYAWVATPRQHRVDSVRPQTSIVASQTVPEASFTEVEDLSLPEGPAKVFTKPRQNLFGPIFSPLPPQPVKRSSPPPAPRPERVESTPKPAPGVSETRQKAFPQLDILGYLVKNGQHTVFLRTANGHIHLLHQGDRFGPGLVIAELEDQTVRVAEPASGRQQLLKLEQGKTQRLPRSNFSSGRPKFVAPKIVEQPEASQQNATGQPSSLPKNIENPFLEALKKAKE